MCKINIINWKGKSHQLEFQLNALKKACENFKNQLIILSEECVMSDIYSINPNSLS